MAPSSNSTDVQIFWVDNTAHRSNKTLRQEGIDVVKKFLSTSDGQNLVKRGARFAQIASTFHGGDGKPYEHITVEFKTRPGTTESDFHVATRHIPGSRPTSTRLRPPAVRNRKAFTMIDGMYNPDNIAIVPLDPSTDGSDQSRSPSPSTHASVPAPRPFYRPADPSFSYARAATASATTSSGRKGQRSEYLPDSSDDWKDVPAPSGVSIVVSHHRGNSLSTGSHHGTGSAGFSPPRYEQTSGTQAPYSSEGLSPANARLHPPNTGEVGYVSYSDPADLSARFSGLSMGSGRGGSHTTPHSAMSFRGGVPVQDTDELAMRGLPRGTAFDARGGPPHRGDHFGRGGVPVQDTHELVMRGLPQGATFDARGGPPHRGTHSVRGGVPVQDTHELVMRGLPQGTNFDARGAPPHRGAHPMGASGVAWGSHEAHQIQGAYNSDQGRGVSHTHQDRGSFHAPQGQGAPRTQSSSLGSTQGYPTHGAPPLRGAHSSRGIPPAQGGFPNRGGFATAEMGAEYYGHHRAPGSGRGMQGVPPAGGVRPSEMWHPSHGTSPDDGNTAQRRSHRRGRRSPSPNSGRGARQGGDPRGRF